MKSPPRDLCLFKQELPLFQSSLTSAILSHGRLSGFAASGEDFQSHIAAGLGPFVVLLGQHRADQADDSVAAREDDTTSVRLRTSLLRRSCGLLDQTWRQTSRGKAVNAKMSSRVIEMRCRGRELGLQRGDDLGVLSADRGRVGLLEDGPDQGRYPRLRRFRHPGEQVAMVVRTTALPGGSGQHGGDRVHQPGVVVAGHHRDAGQAAGDQAAQERQPPAPSSAEVTSMPRISRHPSALTPVAIRQCTLTVRPPRGPSGSARRSSRTCTARAPAAGSGTRRRDRPARPSR